MQFPQKLRFPLDELFVSKFEALYMKLGVKTNNSLVVYLCGHFFEPIFVKPTYKRTYVRVPKVLRKHALGELFGIPNHQAERELGNSS